MANNAINADGQKRRFALLLPAGYGQRYANQAELRHGCYCLTCVT